MVKKKTSLKLFSVCIQGLILITLIGCSTFTQKSEVISLQKKRIQRLEQEVKRRDQKISKIENKLFVKSLQKENEKKSLLKLKKMMGQKQWLEALQESARLKKQYPRSATLTQYRAIIFKRMGLKRQAQLEYNQFKALSAGPSNDKKLKR